MRTDVLRADTRDLWERLSREKFTAALYLAGGTGAALHLGHRESEDLDFFSSFELDTVTLRRELAGLGNLQVVAESRGTLHALLNGVKLSFLEYPYPLLCPLHNYGNCQVADLKEIALMKVTAIAGHGSRKDFIDLYVIAQDVWPVPEILAEFPKKYSTAQYDPYHIKRSLIWFDDAEADPWPILHRQVDWDKLKAFFVGEVSQL